MIAVRLMIFQCNLYDFHITFAFYTYDNQFFQTISNVSSIINNFKVY